MGKVEVSLVYKAEPQRRCLHSALRDLTADRARPRTSNRSRQNVLFATNKRFIRRRLGLII